MDHTQQARELLAAEYERDGITHVPDCIRHEAMLTEIEHRAIRAISAALRAAPEGFVLVPVEPTAQEVSRASFAIPASVPTLEAAREVARRVLIAARQQGVK